MRRVSVEINQPDREEDFPLEQASLHRLHMIGKLTYGSILCYRGQV